MRNEIAAVVRLGGTVEFPFKKRMLDWFSKNEIFKTDGDVTGKDYVVRPAGNTFKTFAGLDEAVDYFMSITFTAKNYGLIFEGVRKHKLHEGDVEDLGDDEIRAVAKRYVEEFFEKDYGDALKEMKEHKNVAD